jgi:hypothetical protein
VSLIADGAPVAAVAGAAMTAADSALARAMGVDRDASEGIADAANDPGFVQSFWLLTQVVVAAQEQDFAGALQQAGIHVPAAPTLFEVTSAFATAAHDAMWAEGKPSDIGEIARLAATETLTSLCSRTPKLFPSESEVQQALKEMARPRSFGTVAEECFSRFTKRYLLYMLSRELSGHVGKGRRFNDLQANTAFSEAIDTHCRQVARIVREFAGEWFSKSNYEGGITLRKARGFSHVALKKIRSEMSRR